MTAKNLDAGAGKPGAATTTTDSQKPARKAWKKKTPVDVMLEQIDRLRDDVSEKEQDLKKARTQLTKLEEVAKVLVSQ